MARILGFYCFTCGKSQDVLTYDSEASIDSLAPQCCGAAMRWTPGVALTIANPNRLTSRGMPVSSIGQNYLDVCKQDQKYAEKYPGHERAEIRKTRDEHDKAVKEGRKSKRIQVG